MNRAQNIIQLFEAFGGSTAPSGMKRIVHGPNDIEYNYQTMINGVPFEFVVGASDDNMSFLWLRDDRVEREGQPSQIEGMRAISIMMNMARYVIKIHRDKLRLIVFSASTTDPGKVRLYKILGAKLAQENNGRMQYHNGSFQITLPPPY